MKQLFDAALTNERFRLARYAVVVSLLAVWQFGFASGRVVADPSELWGERGEKWTAQSRLPDFSFAGYHCGEAPLPQVKVVSSVKDFGAVGDGATDDTAAFIKAVKETPKGAIFIPEGRYVLTDVVRIAKSNLVLRGAGMGKTILVIPKSLAQILGAKTNDGTKSSYAFSGGFITVAGKFEGEKLADVALPALRGDRQFTLSGPVKVAPGTFIRLTMKDADHTLGRYLHADEEDAGVDTYKSLATKNWIDWAARVESVKGNQITFDHPLRLDVRPEWKPEIRAYEPTVSEVGIEDLSFEFAGVAKLAHLKEEGFNAIHMTSAADCWVRNVSFVDADNGVILGGSRFCTVTNTRFEMAKRTGLTGHHALWATGAQDCLFTDFRFDTTYVHDLTVEGRANGNVFRHGSGVSLNFDHHRNAPYENLFTDLDVGDPKRIWDSSGRDDRGPHTGARETFWDLRADKAKFPKPPKWPQINVVGVPGYTPDTTPQQQWIEPLDVQPIDLYQAQLDRRLKKP